MSGTTDRLLQLAAEDSETCLKHPDRKPVAYSVMCRECYDQQRRFAEAATRLLEACEREYHTIPSAVGAAMVRLRKVYHDA